MNLGLGLGLGFNRGGVSDEWTPKNLTGINTWFDANDLTKITVDGSNRVSEWYDSITGVNKYIQGVQANQPIYDSVAKEIIFDGTNSKFMTRAHTLNQFSNLSFIFILKIINKIGSESQYFLCNSAGAAAIQIGQLQYIGAAETCQQYLYGGTTIGSSGVSLSKQKSAHRMYFYNYLATNPSISSIISYACKADGSNVVASSSANTVENRFNNSTPLYLGKHQYSAIRYLNARVKSVISIVGTPSESDLNSIYQWAKSYYGVNAGD